MERTMKLAEPTNLTLKEEVAMLRRHIRGYQENAEKSLKEKSNLTGELHKLGYTYKQIDNIKKGKKTKI
jgi:hypothetical protein